MEYSDYKSMPSEPVPAEFGGRPPHLVARLMVANPGTDFRTAVRDYDRLFEALQSGNTQSAVAALGPAETPAKLNENLMRQEYLTYGSDYERPDIEARLTERYNDISAAIPYTTEGAPHLGAALKYEINLEARSQHCRSIQQQPTPQEAGRMEARKAYVDHLLKGLPPGAPGGAPLPERADSERTAAGTGAAASTAAAAATAGWDDQGGGPGGGGAAGASAASGKAAAGPATGAMIASVVAEDVAIAARRTTRQDRGGQSR